MLRRPFQAIGLVAMLALAGCSGYGSATPAASSPAGGASAGGGAGGCAASAAAGTVAVAIKDFEFTPAAISAKVGDVITFTNGGTKSHSATLDQGTCSTDVLTPGASGGLTFSQAGTYAFHCKIHASMTGTITVSQ